ncbi:MAG: hypothetical protein HOP21_10680 [Methylotenera sp.]|nr:hypothetical protein [Methylotenera sp.]
MNEFTVLILVGCCMLATYVIGWRWINGRFGYALDGKWHLLLIIFGLPFVLVAIGLVYLVTKIKDGSSGKTENDEIDI